MVKSYIWPLTSGIERSIRQEEKEKSRINFRNTLCSPLNRTHVNIIKDGSFETSQYRWFSLSMLRIKTFAIVFKFLILLCRQRGDMPTGGGLKQIIVLFNAIFFISGCLDGDVDFIEENKPSYDSGLVGYWFQCEFGSTDNCFILDNDGYQFTKDGKFYVVRESTNNSEPECQGSPCFHPGLPKISIERTLFGTYNYKDTSLTIALENCSVTMEFQTNVTFNSLPSDNCFNFRSPVGKYHGTVTLTKRHGS